MAETTKEARIKKEKRRILKIFSSIDPNKKQITMALIDRAAFITVSLQDLEDELNESGWTEAYQNGENQSGIKKAAAADVHISLTKNLNAIIKQLLDITPPAQKAKSKLEMLRDE